MKLPVLKLIAASAISLGLGLGTGLVAGTTSATASSWPATPIAKSATEAAFISSAIKSCHLAMAKGVTEVMGETTVVFQPMATRDGFYDHTAIATDSQGKAVANPFDYWQPLCLPADMNDSLKTVLRLHLVKNASLEHRFAKKSVSTYVWSQHLGAPDWSTFTYTVKNSLIVSFGGGGWNQTKVFYGK